MPKRKSKKLDPSTIARLHRQLKRSIKAVQTLAADIEKAIGKAFK